MPQSTAPESSRFDYAPRAEIAIVNSSPSAYSQIVYWLKIILPALALAALLAIMVWPNLMESENRFRISSETIATQAPQSSLIVRPRYVGNNGKGVTYSIQAAAAAPSPQDIGAVNLNQLQVSLQSVDQKTLLMTADRATYWRNRNGMTAQGNIIVHTSSGQTIQTDLAHADFTKGVFWGDTAISGQSPQGSFTANGFETDENGSRVVLRGKVHLVLLPKAQAQTTGQIQ